MAEKAPDGLALLLDAPPSKSDTPPSVMPGDDESAETDEDALVEVGEEALSAVSEGNAEDFVDAIKLMVKLIR